MCHLMFFFCISWYRYFSCVTWNVTWVRSTLGQKISACKGKHFRFLILHRVVVFFFRNILKLHALTSIRMYLHTYLQFLKIVLYYLCIVEVRLQFAYRKYVLLHNTAGNATGCFLFTEKRTCNLTSSLLYRWNKLIHIFSIIDEPKGINSLLLLWQ